jgi:hypothetical protein
MTIIFSGLTKHGKLILAPNVPTSFDDEGAEEYFVKCGWASETDQEAAVTYPEGMVEVDPETRHNESGLLVKDIVVDAPVEGVK